MFCTASFNDGVIPKNGVIPTSFNILVNEPGVLVWNGDNGKGDNNEACGKSSTIQIKSMYEWKGA
jgi:hypothetical protein